MLVRVLSRDRLIVVAALTTVVILSAWYILDGAGTGMSALDMSRQTGPAGALIAGTPDMVSPYIWSTRDAVIVFVMWWLMMIAMMVPSAAPTILLYEALYRNGGARGPLEFLSGYLVAWAGFSLAATILQGLLSANALVSAMYMNFSSPAVAAAVLVAAGLYQLSPLKAACLDHCRSPAEALTRHRRTGRAAAFRMGLIHGRYCLGCCWGLMALLFVGGIMNIWWIAATALWVAVEKLAPGGRRASQFMAGALIVAGLAFGLKAFHVS